MEKKQFKKGEVIFKEGSLGSTMYEIQSGTVGIYISYGTPAEKKLTELEPGRIFGEMGVIEVYPRSATAVALTDIETEEINTEDLQEYFKSRPDKLLEIMRHLSRRTREMTNDYMEVCNTIHEMDHSKSTGSKRGEGLLAKIKRFVAEYEAVQKEQAKSGNPGFYFYYHI